MPKQVTIEDVRALAWEAVHGALALRRRDHERCERRVLATAVYGPLASGDPMQTVDVLEVIDEPFIEEQTTDLTRLLPGLVPGRLYVLTLTRGLLDDLSGRRPPSWSSITESIEVIEDPDGILARALARAKTRRAT